MIRTPVHTSMPIHGLEQYKYMKNNVFCLICHAGGAIAHTPAVFFHFFSSKRPGHLAFRDTSKNTRYCQTRRKWQSRAITTQKRTRQHRVISSYHSRNVNRRLHTANSIWSPLTRRHGRWWSHIGDDTASAGSPELHISAVARQCAWHLTSLLGADRRPQWHARH